MNRSLAIILFTVSLPAAAIDQIGPTYPIKEPNMLLEIHKKLAEKERNGELEKLQKEFAERSRRSIENPKPVEGLTATRFPRTFYYDPTFVAPETIVAPDGRIIVKAGDKTNPLEYVSLSKHLIFFDANDKRQREKALLLSEHYGGNVKLILVAGPVIQLMRDWKRQLFFDQSGAIVRKFGILQVPAIVSQEGMRLRIDELEL